MVSTCEHAMVTKHCGRLLSVFRAQAGWPSTLTVINYATEPLDKRAATRACTTQWHAHTDLGLMVLYIQFTRCSAHTTPRPD